MNLLKRWTEWRRETDERPSSKHSRPTSAVIFHCSEKDADGIDVAIGPCVPRVGPRGGRLRPLVSPHLQHRVTSLDQVAGLFTVLTGGPAADAFDSVRRGGSGSLARLVIPFGLGSGGQSVPQSRSCNRRSPRRSPGRSRFDASTHGSLRLPPTVASVNQIATFTLLSRRRRWSGPG